MKRVLIMAEMHGRDLVRRRIALGLLVALPLSFYLASASSDTNAPAAGGVGMAFAVAGAALFSILSSRDVDQRLVLCGYRPIELLLGRLGFLAPAALVVSAGFAGLMTVVSDPARPWILAAGVALVGLQAIPVGLAVGAVFPRELEGTLTLVGIVGVQLAVAPHSLVSELLPFYGPRRILEAGVSGSGPIAWPLAVTAAYGFALLLVGRLALAERVGIRRPAPGAPPPDDAPGAPRRTQEIP